MLYKKWSFFYKKIAEDLKLKLEYEKKAAKLMNNILKEKEENILSENNLKKIIKNKEIIVFGAGPSLEKNLKNNKKFIKNKIIITADGATSALLKNNILPDIIVTDLDGNIPDQIKANNNGSIILIHTHGDNFEKIKHYITSFKGKVIGTTQINPAPYNYLKNYGGFTDGDRAVFLSDHFQAKKIYLVGFDYDEQIGRYSFADNKDKKLKLKKLEWCKKLIEILQKKNNNIHYLEP